MLRQLSTLRETTVEYKTGPQRQPSEHVLPIWLCGHLYLCFQQTMKIMRTHRSLADSHRITASQPTILLPGSRHASAQPRFTHLGPRQRSCRLTRLGISLPTPSPNHLTPINKHKSFPHLGLRCVCALPLAALSRYTD